MWLWRLHQLSDARIVEKRPRTFAICTETEQFHLADGSGYCHCTLISILSHTHEHATYSTAQSTTNSREYSDAFTFRMQIRKSKSGKSLYKWIFDNLVTNSATLMFPPALSQFDYAAFHSPIAFGKLKAYVLHFFSSVLFCSSINSPNPNILN